MPNCAAIGCTNKSSAKSKAQLNLEKYMKITFHRFPKKVEKRKMWIDQMGLTEKSLPKVPYLCSCHFTNESFDRTSLCNTRLRDWAVPSIHNVSLMSNTASNQGTVVLQEISNTNVDHIIDIETVKREPSVENEAFIEDEVEESARIDISPKDFCEMKDACSQTSSENRSVDKATWVSKSLLADSPTTLLLRSVIRNQKDTYEKQIKLLKQTARRKDKRIETLKAALAELKKQKKI